MNTLYRKTGRKAILSDCFLPFAQRLFYQSLDINIDTLTVFKENCTHFIMRYTQKGSENKRKIYGYLSPQREIFDQRDVPVL